MLPVPKSCVHWEVLEKRKQQEIIKLCETQEVTEETLAADIQLPKEIIQQWIQT